MGIKYCLHCGVPVTQGNFGCEKLRFSLGDLKGMFMGLLCKRCAKLEFERLCADVKRWEEEVERNRTPQWQFSYAWRR